MRMCLAIPVLATFSVLSPPSAFNSVSGIRFVPSFLAERKMRPPFLISPLPPSFAPRSPPLFSFCFSFQYYRQQLTTSSLSDGLRYRKPDRFKMDRLAWTACLLILLSCISTTNTVYGHELSEGLELMNDEAVKIQGDAAFPAIGDPANIKADITYLVHVTKGVKKSEMEDLVNFLKSLLSNANIASGDIPELRTIASEPSGLHSFFVDDYASLSSVTPNILSMIPPIDVSASIPTVPVPSKPANPRVYTRCYNVKADLVFILDTSARVTEADFQRMLQFNARSSLNSKKTFLQAKRARDKFFKIIAVGIGFPGVQELDKISSDGFSFPTQDFRTLETQLTSVAQAICFEIDLDYFIPERGQKNPFGSASEAPSPTQPDRVEVPTNSKLYNKYGFGAVPTVPEAENARADNIHIYAVGIGLADTTELSQIASPPISDNMFVVDDFQALSALEKKILDQFCPAPRTTPVPLPPKGKTSVQSMYLSTVRVLSHLQNFFSFSLALPASPPLSFSLSLSLSLCKLFFLFIFKIPTVIFSLTLDPFDLLKQNSYYYPPFSIS
ncbi:COL6A [Acanthosepion pharaonis]|uniref:COL6A n=1 Tax=Acanthosepion pharaonis TaxID=158019 RepID=A0A812BVG1_ACAPH|nr:COL6A [Sepia pharaonis]